MERLYQAMDLFVFPSRYEGLGMAVVEAQICGVRTIVSTAVPEETRITDRVVFMKLSEGAKVWAEYVGHECGRTIGNAELDDSLDSVTQDIGEAREIYDVQFQAEKMVGYYGKRFYDGSRENAS